MHRAFVAISTIFVLVCCGGSNGSGPSSPSSMGQQSATERLTVEYPGTRLWTVTCGLPQADNPFAKAVMSALERDIPWPESAYAVGHLQAKMIQNPHPEGGLSTELWLLSRGVGWWKLKSIRVHPEDITKVEKLADKMDMPMSDGNVKDFMFGNRIRQIIESPFLARPAIIVGGTGEDSVNAEILALLPNAHQLRCVPQPND